jgi:hypothetical protein
MILPERGVNIGAICDHRPKLISKEQLEIRFNRFESKFLPYFSTVCSKLRPSYPPKQTKNVTK